MAGRKSSAIIALSAGCLSVAACDLGGAGERANAERAVAASIRATAHEGLPAGFSLAAGRGGIRDLSVADNDGAVIAAFATIASPRAINDHYRREAEAAGMTFAGQMEASDMLVTNYRRDNPEPRSLSVSALQKGEFTNVTLSFGVAD
jgi:hypothetical protein